RVRIGRGGALTAALVFVAIRGFLALLVGPIIGQTTPHFPLYLAEAGLVELVGLRYDARRPIMLGAVAGALIGTVGFGAEYGWQALIAYIPWTPSLIAEGVTCALVAGTAGGVLGGWIGRSVVPPDRIERAPRWVVPAAGLAAVAVMAWALPMPNGSNVPRATVSLRNVAAPPHREAIPVAGIPAPAHFARPFERDKKLLQREQKGNVPAFLTLTAYLIVLAVWSAMIAIVSWALWRLAKSTRPHRPDRPPARSRRKPMKRTPATAARA